MKRALIFFQLVCLSQETLARNEMAGPGPTAPQVAPASSPQRSFDALEACESQAQPESSGRKIVSPETSSREDSEDRQFLQFTKKMTEEGLATLAASECAGFDDRTMKEFKPLVKAISCANTELKVNKQFDFGPGAGNPNPALLGNQKPQLSCSVAKTAAADQSAAGAKGNGFQLSTPEELANQCKEFQAEILREMQGYRDFAIRSAPSERDLMTANDSLRRLNYQATVQKQVADFLKKKHDQCTQDADRLRGSNPLLGFVDQQSPNDLQAAKKRCAESAIDGRAKIQRHKIDPKTAGSLGFLSVKSSVNEALQKNPEFCGAYLRLKGQAAAKFGKNKLVDRLEDGLLALGLVTGPASNFFLSSAVEGLEAGRKYLGRGDVQAKTNVTQSAALLPDAVDHAALRNDRTVADQSTKSIAGDMALGMAGSVVGLGKTGRLVAKETAGLHTVSKLAENAEVGKVIVRNPVEAEALLKWNRETKTVDAAKKYYEDMGEYFLGKIHKETARTYFLSGGAMGQYELTIRNVSEASRELALRTRELTELKALRDHPRVSNQADPSFYAERIKYYESAIKYLNQVIANPSAHLVSH